MGQIAKATQGNQLTQARPQDGIQRMLTHAWPRIAAVMPKHMSSERLFQIALSTINQTPKLAECSSASILSCVMKCSALGLEPSAVDGLGRAYILPFYNNKSRQMEATLIIGYKGLIDLARNSGQLKSIHAQAVYEGDAFDYWEDETGQHFKFKPNRQVEHKPENMTDVYMTATLLDGGFVFEHMTKAEVDAIRKRSKSSNSGPWVTDYEAMALKTVIRRAARYLPMSTEARQAVASDEQTPDYSGVLQPVFTDERETVEVANESEPQPESEAQTVPVGVNPITGEIGADFGSESPEIEIADEDIPFPDGN